MRKNKKRGGRAVRGGEEKEKKTGTSVRDLQLTGD